MKILWAVLFLLLSAGLGFATGCAADMPTLTRVMIWLRQIGWPLGLFMMVYMGIKWIISEGPEERENARRGLIYVVIGLILLQGAIQLAYGLLCW